MVIDRQFFVQLQGRDFVLFAGLQDGATRAGLKSVVTTVVQLPTAENGRLAVMKARVEFEDGRVFEAIGDASPDSVGRMILPHILRMAETRAVGRAYRWALNIGATMREELGGDDEPKQDSRSAHHERTVQPGDDGPVASGVRGGEAAGQPARAAARAPAGGAGAAAAAPARCSVEGCDRFITPKQKAETLSAYGEMLCPLHARQMAEQQP